MNEPGLPPLTLWQFYAEVIVQIVLGVGFCYVLYHMSDRNPRYGWTSPEWAVKARNGMAWVLIFLAGIASFETLPDVVHSFTNDVAETVANTSVEIATKAITADPTAQPLNEPKVVEPEKGYVWGQPMHFQNKTLMLLAAFWIAIGWWLYTICFTSSLVPMWKKILKPVGYGLLTVPLLLWPMGIHYFSWDELKIGVICLIGAGVIIALTHHYGSPPPEIPVSKGSPTPKIPQIPQR